MVEPRRVVPLAPYRDGVRDDVAEARGPLPLGLVDGMVLVVMAVVLWLVPRFGQLVDGLACFLSGVSLPR